MLLLTYDPSVKQNPDHAISLTSPYGNGATIRQIRVAVAFATAFGALMEFVKGDITKGNELMDISREALS